MHKDHACVYEITRCGNTNVKLRNEFNDGIRPADRFYVLFPIGNYSPTFPHGDRVDKNIQAIRVKLIACKKGKLADRFSTKDTVFRTLSNTILVFRFYITILYDMRFKSVV